MKPPAVIAAALCRWAIANSEKALRKSGGSSLREDGAEY